MICITSSSLTTIQTRNQLLSVDTSLHLQSIMVQAHKGHQYIFAKQVISIQTFAVRHTTI